MLGHQIHAVANFAQSTIEFAGASFRAESHKSSTEQALHLRIRLLAQRFSHLANGSAQQITSRPSEQISQLRQSNCGPATGFSISRIQTTEVILQNGSGSFFVPALQQQFDKLSNVARRHAGSFMGEQYAFLSRFGHLGPEHPIQDVGMRFHQDPSLAHLVFLKL